MTSSGGRTIELFLLLLLLLSSAAWASLCETWKADVRRSDESVRVSRNYKGLWLSERCEVLPGPRFLLRRYHFLRNGKFHLIRFYYSDPWCSHAIYSVTAAGRFRPSPEKAAGSWIVPGALEPDYYLRKVTVVPFTSTLLSQNFNDSCPDIAEWKPYRKYRVFSDDEPDVRRRRELRADCNRALGLSFKELQLTRLENRIPARFAVDGTRRRSFLFLGAEGVTTPNLRPTYYQPPLIPAQTQFCTTCHLLSRASSSTMPPSLPELRNSEQELTGRWISLQCEVRPHGLFLRREFFFGDDRRWTGRHEYFRDPQCERPMFTLSAVGTFSPGLPSAVITEAVERDFHISQSSVRPDDPQFANNMNGLAECGTGPWRVGREMNLSNSGGCKELGIRVPSEEMEVFRLVTEKPGLTFLQMGDGPEDDGSRPTSFQSPLVRCSSSKDAAEDRNLLFNDLRPMPLVSANTALESTSCLLAFCGLLTLAAL